jgi:hypothetical protein
LKIRASEGKFGIGIADAFAHRHATGSAFPFFLHFPRAAVMRFEPACYFPGRLAGCGL